MPKRLIAAAILALGLIAVLAWSQRRQGPLKVSGFIEADEIRIGSRVGGRVARVQAVEGQIVKAGEPLIELEPFQLRELLAQARGELGRVQAELDRLLKGFRDEEKAQAKAKYDQLEALVTRFEEAGGITWPGLMDLAAERWAVFPALAAEWALRTGNDFALEHARSYLTPETGARLSD